MGHDALHSMLLSTLVRPRGECRNDDLGTAEAHHSGKRDARKIKAVCDPQSHAGKCRVLERP